MFEQMTMIAVLGQLGGHMLVFLFHSFQSKDASDKSCAKANRISVFGANVGRKYIANSSSPVDWRCIKRPVEDLTDFHYIRRRHFN